MKKFLSPFILCMMVLLPGTAAAGEVLMVVPPPPPPPPGTPPPAPPLHHRHNVRVRSAPGPYVHRKCTRYRCRRHAPRPFLKRAVYHDWGFGSFSLLKPKGAYRFLTPGFAFSHHLGFSFNPFLALELGYVLAFPKEKDGALGGVKNMALAGVIVDFKLRLAVASRKNHVVPYLLTGLGVYLLSGKRRLAGGCFSEDSNRLAHGGGLRVGAGIDFFAHKNVSLGVRAVYQALFMSQFRCGEGDSARCAEFRTDKPQTLHGLTALGTLTIYFPF